LAGFVSFFLRRALNFAHKHTCAEYIYKKKRENQYENITSTSYIVTNVKNVILNMKIFIQKDKIIFKKVGSRSLFWVGHCFGTFYFKFKDNDKSLFTKIMILSELSYSNTQTIE